MPKKENNQEETKKKKTTAKKTSATKSTSKSGSRTTSKTTAKPAAKKTASVKKTGTSRKKKTEVQEEEKEFVPKQPDFNKVKFSFSNTMKATAVTQSQKPQETVKQEAPAPEAKKTTTITEQTQKPATAEITKAAEKPAVIQKKPAFVVTPKPVVTPNKESESVKPQPASETKNKPEQKRQTAAPQNTATRSATGTQQKPAQQQPVKQQKPQLKSPQKPEERIFVQPKPAVTRPAITMPQQKKSSNPLPPLMRPRGAKAELPAIMRPSKPKQETKTENRPVENRGGKPQQKQQQQPRKQQETKKEQPKETAAVTSSQSQLPKIKMSTEFVLRDLAEKLNVKPTDFIKKLMSMGVFATINQRLDKDTAILMAAEYGYDLELVPMFGEEELEEELKKEDEKNLKLRYPIITIMGHVDHGKTTLLDALRESNVVDTEAGQITQHIGAYMVTTSRGRITVLDTPGHEAFTAMRANGVKVTDIVVLVVSAVDGVMPQTLEAINHAKAANVPIIVAVNKIDLPTANPQQIKQQLSNYGLVAEEWGGQTPMIEISAKKRLNLDKLLEIISIQAELMELKANPDKPGQAIVIEARLDPKKGVVATVIDVTGTLKLSDPFTVGTAYGKVRALISDRGDRLSELKPGEPAEVLGISGEVPQAGDIMKVAKNDKEARHISEKRKLSRREENLSHQKQVSLMSLKSQVDSKELRNLNVVLKTDVFGSLQAIKDSLEKLSTQEVAISILHSGVGNITESDVLLAKASNAIIIGFHVTTDSKVEEAAKTAKVEIRSYEIIYDLIEDVKAAMSGLLAPEIVEVVTGKAEIQQIFDLSSGKVCGSLAREGKITRGQFVHIIRGKDIIGTAKISGLKRFKDDVREVEKGLECGILLEGFKDFQTGDIIEAFNKEEKLRRLANV